ncbi:sugar ABC transporter permease [Microbacterium sp. EYE_5]|uniref:carbohydrate ABC transporter permease n=1 Tax=unclassified Microbacterium TaxID=2609290 RepID=UPI00200335A6|nr:MULTISPECIES: sugar ABC transporter permease [unclassified Microbacterium]MCK6079399.1 sugar ABC transporter permease [Microbacterium sp. EYE_382]MCK6084669.1 sugar ABC transporter permease [Microbacterium sp. EYE_384]MCK6123102.1 sugar ABC transporter permease [Microbacterium sp. EYE_80]MCK6125433.1 sugar ABC transporter permease [Microbacterium sp. EYE_79]MCK6140353.1 sugar ABC transporter permease [Microbacterium sp. EYE_39]
MARKWTRYPKRTFYAFVAPWAVGFLLLTAAPMIYGLLVSFTNFDGSSPRYKWVGLNNYIELFSDADAWAALLRTLAFTAIVVPLTVGGSLGLATIINRRLRAVGVWRTVFFLPSVVPVVAMAIMWKLIFNKDAGILNAMGKAFGIPPTGWLVDPAVFYSLIILMLWGVGGGMIIMLAALQGVPRELEEAAIVDGAGRWTVFRHVTIPMISPILFFQVVTGVIAALQVFVQPLLLTNSAGLSGAAAVPESTTLYMVQVYQEFFLNNRFGYGSAMLWIFFIIILGLTLVLLRSSRSWVYYEVDADAEREGAVK